ncbi:MAG: PAS domain S-box protein [Nitrospirae bacterium]|nr:PAS domain S-box protein [Nitrospirota bacterium]
MKLAHKLTIGFLAVALLIWTTGYLIIDISRKTLEELFVDNAESLSKEILSALEKEIYNKVEVFREYSRDIFVPRTLIKSNREFEKLGNIQQFLEQKNAEWKNTPENAETPFMRSLTENDLSEELKEKTEYYRERYGHNIFSEVFFTNKYGAVVAMTNRTEDYRQDDEEWWQAAKKNGLYVEDVKYDKSANDYCISVGLRIDDEDGNFLGAMKFLLSAKQITATLNNLKTYIQNEQDRHNVKVRLITHDKKLIYSSEKGDRLFQDFFHSFKPGLFQEIQKTRALSAEHDGRLSVYIQAQDYKDIKGLGWILITDYDAEEVFAPVIELRNKISFISLSITLFAVVLGVFMSSRITKSILKLRDTAIKFGKGEQDVKIDINSHDEIGELADAFNQMREDLKMTAMVRDKLTEDLQEGEERLRSVIETANDAIASFDSEGRVIFWNATAERIFGYTTDEAVGRHITGFMSKQFHDFCQKELAPAVVLENEDIIGKTVEITGQKKDGREFPAELSIAIWRKKGETFFTAIFRDITDRKHSEELIGLQLNRLNVLHSIEKAVNSSIDLHSTLDILTDQITTQLGIDAVSVLLLNKHTQSLDHVINKGFRSSALKHTHLRLGEGNAGRAAVEQRIIGIANLVQEPDGFVRSRLFPDEKFVSYFAVPLIAKGDVKGVLELFYRSQFDANPDWLDFLDTIADQAAIAIDHASLFNDLQHSRNELILAYDSTIVGWSTALDMRDKETEGHSLRVTDLTTRIAMEIGISGDELVHIRRGALLHDIGKMGIPDNILLKPGKLTDEEWVIMKRHPLYAYDMLSGTDYLRPALDIPLYHHEKWDGSGYPKGLEGKAIPLAARIFAVVDVWDALTSNRPYRPAWAKEKTLAYIRSQAGTHFDPEVVEVFMKMAYNNYPQEEPQLGPHDGLLPPASTKPSLSPSTI